MDKQLKNATGNKEMNVYEFVSIAVWTEPTEYFTSVHRPTNDDEIGGNIFHLAAHHNNLRFFDAALGKLPKDIVHPLLSQQDARGAQNPIHLAANEKCNSIMRLLIEFYKREKQGSTIVHSKPWLAQDEEGKTPLHYVLDSGYQNQALQILSLIGVDKVSNIEDKSGRSPLFLAVKRGFSRVADKILRSTYSLRGSYGYTALYFAPNFSDDICHRLLQKHSNLIVGKTSNTVLHQWAEIGKIYPFKQVIEGDLITDPALKNKFIDQLSTLDDMRGNPLHVIAQSKYDKARAVEVAKILVESYKLQKSEAPSTPQKAMLPWFQKNNEKRTPLGSAIANHNEQLALYFLRLDSVYFVAENHEDDLLYLAIENGCSHVTKEILDIADQCNLDPFQSIYDRRTILHVAPESTEAILRRVLENYPELINEFGENGETVLHSWITIGKLWPFECILSRDYVNSKSRLHFIYLLEKEDMEGRKPLHLAATCSNVDVIKQVVELLLDAWDQEHIGCHPSWYLRWLGKDNQGHTPLLRAKHENFEALVLYFLSRHLYFEQMENKQVRDILFTAIEYGWQQVVNYVVDRAHLDWRPIDCLFSRQMNVLHVGWKSTEKNCKLVTERWPELIHGIDEDEKTPLERASEAGATWLVELILQMDHSSIILNPLAWVEACNNRHLSAILAFADKSPHFRNLCRESRDTPLHHLEDLSYKDYQKLLEDASIKELRNIQNSEGETPLHTTIRSENKNLMKILLTMKDVDRTIKDNNNRTAMDLLKDICRINPEWQRMCEVIGVGPNLKTTYTQVKNMDLAEMRNTISLVTALLAAIRFTAGFTVPSGFKSNSGEPILVMKATFLVFLISDTYAMCCSMLILFCIIWSMVCDRNKSSLLIDRSLVLLKHSLYGTLLAFMTGVYTIIHHNSLWAAIVIISMCSIVMILACSRSILSYAIPKVIPASEDEHRLMRLLLCCQCCNRKKQQQQGQDAISDDNESSAPKALPFDIEGEKGLDSTI